MICDQDHLNLGNADPNLLVTLTRRPSRPQVLDGLQYLHWRGVAHLDLQPDNIVLTTCRRVDVKLVDFGSAQKVTKLGAQVQRCSLLEYTGMFFL